MEFVEYPKRELWAGLAARPMSSDEDRESLSRTVAGILADVRERGDEALRDYALKFDGVSLANLAVTQEEFAEAEIEVPEDLKKAITKAAKNINEFHAAQIAPVERMTTSLGVNCWLQPTPIEKVGLYVPGGQAPLFSTVLMLAVPAKVAGCGQIVLCTPASREGKVNPAILYAAKVAGVDKVFKVGGAQAVAAMAYGTQTIPQVYKICGPGNRFVTEAKQQVSLRDAAIDMPAGPSEVMIIADEDAQPSFVAADLLAQAEHGPDSQAMLLTDSPELFAKVKDELEAQLADLPRREVAQKSLSHSRAILFNDMKETVDFANLYGPEHLILQTPVAIRMLQNIRNAGAVFMGQMTPESAGDYAAGVNHTLPTSGFARMYSGVNLDTFRKKISVLQMDFEGVANISWAVELMAQAEHLDGHARAMRLRREYIESISD